LATVNSKLPSETGNNYPEPFQLQWAVKKGGVQNPFSPKILIKMSKLKNVAEEVSA